MKRALMLLLLSPLLASAQNVRYDQPFSTISSKYGEPLLVAIVPPNNLAVSVCNSPANAVPCTNYATTFDSLGNPCPNGAQDTPQPQPSACQSTADAQGNIGFWVAPGKYDFTACVGGNCFSSPYTITLSTIGSGTVGGAGTATFIPKWTTTVAQGNSALADTGSAITSSEPLILGASPAGACGTSASCIAIGATPPTACGNAGSCIAWNEGAVAGTPTVGQDYVRADSATHGLLKSFNGAAESAFGGGTGTVTGTGTLRQMPEWTSTTAIGNSPFADIISPRHKLQDDGTYTLEFEFGRFYGSGTAGGSGENTAGATLEVNATEADCSAADCFGSNFIMQAKTTTDTSNRIAGLQGYVSTLGSSNANFGQIDGAFFSAQNNINATLASLNGIEVFTGFGGTAATSTVTLQTGGNFTSRAKDHTITTNAGVFSQTSSGCTNCTTTTDADFYAASPAYGGTGTATHHYGLYLANQAAGSNNADPWGIFEAASDKNQFGPSTFTGTITTTAVAFSALAACSGGIEGSMRAVTDSTTAVWGATITGGGANHVLGYCNGTNWTVAAK